MCVQGRYVYFLAFFEGRPFCLTRDILLLLLTNFVFKLLCYTHTIISSVMQIILNCSKALHNASQRETSALTWCVLFTLGCHCGAIVRTLRGSNHAGCRPWLDDTCEGMQCGHCTPHPRARDQVRGTSPRDNRNYILNKKWLKVPL